jgi:hypothetical protein
MARPRTSPEAKAAKKERDAASKADALAQNALAKLPAEQEKRDELWQELKGLKAEAAEAAGNISAHKKRMTDVFGYTKAAQKIIAILDGCRQGEYEATMEQVALTMKDRNRPFQMRLDLQPGKGVAEDEGSVFDSTGSGDKMAAERLDDPGRASKRRGPPAPPPVTTPNVGVEGLAAGIKPLESPEEKRAKIDAQKAADAAAFEGTAAKADTIEADTKHMTPAQKRAHAKKIAEEVFAKQDGKGLGPGAVH